MPLLLLLSALLTALTGVAAGVRPLDVVVARQVRAADVRGATLVTAPSVASHAHLLGAFGLVAGFAVAAAARVPVSVARLYLARLRV